MIPIIYTHHVVTPSPQIRRIKKFVPIIYRSKLTGRKNVKKNRTVGRLIYIIRSHVSLIIEGL